MKKFLISATAFPGTAELLYLDDRLVTINAMNAEMSDAQLAYLYKQAPVHISGLEGFAKALKTATIVEADFSISLDDFKHEYPYARNMHLLPDIWRKLSPTDQVRAWLAAREYRKYCEREKKWYKPKIAAAWLTKKEFLNDWKNI